MPGSTIPINEPRRYADAIIDASDMLGTNWGVTASKPLARALERQDEWLRGTLQSIGEGVITIDEDGHVLWLNTVAERMTGWSATDASGRAVADVFRIVDEDTRLPVEMPVTDCMANVSMLPPPGGKLLLSRHGGECIVENTIAPIRSDAGSILGAVLVCRDVTVRRSHEAERVTQELERMSTPPMPAPGEAERVNSARHEQNRLRAAVQALQGVLWTNDAAGRMLGEQPGWAALTGQSIADYQGYGWADAIHPEDAQPTIDVWNQAVAEQRTFVFEHRVRRYDGSWRIFAVHAVPLLDPKGDNVVEWVGVHTDITEQRHAEAALRTANLELAQTADEFRTLAEGMPELCWMAHPDGQIYWYNHRWYEYTGTVAADMEGWGWQSVHDPDVLPSVLERWNATISTGKAFEMTFPLRGADGVFRPFLTRVAPVHDCEGRVRRWLGINVDVSVAHELNAELERRVEARTAELQKMARHLHKARNMAEESSRAKSHFLAAMSHELRTPLNGILGYAQVLRLEGGLNATQDARIVAMMGAGKHLLGMITSVLDMSEIESGRLTLQMEEIDLLEIAGECLDIVAAVAEEKRLSLDLSMGRGMPRRLLTDPTRLRQVLLNLLGNAVKFTTEGSVELRLRRPSMGEGLRIEVTDTGPGIPAESRTRLFQDFERLNTRANATIEGSGLGLALSARLVALLGGQIGYDDKPGGGSVFWLELPLAAGDPSRRLAASPTMLPAPADPSRQIRVLVVDDVEMNREIAQAFLRSGGHQVTCVAGGAEAVAAVAGDDYDVVLMDVRMPGMDGLEATRLIRALPGRAGSVPVVALTAHAFSEQVETCRAAGMTNHVAKPFTQQILLEAVCRAAAEPRYELVAAEPRYELVAAEPRYELVAAEPRHERVAAEPRYERIAAEPRYELVAAEPRHERVAAGAAAPLAMKSLLVTAASDLPICDPVAFKQVAGLLPSKSVADHLRTLRACGEALQCGLRAHGEGKAGEESARKLAATAHTLSGSAGMFGFQRMAFLASRFEQAVEAGSPDVASLAEGLEATITDSISEMRHRIAATEG